MPHGFPLDPPAGGHKEVAPLRLQDVAVAFILYLLGVAFILFWIFMNQKVSREHETPLAPEGQEMQEAI